MAETTGGVCPCTGWSLSTLTVALLPFILPHNTTGSFQSHPLSSRKTMYLRTYELLYFRKVLRNVFSGEVSKLTIY